MEGRTEESLLSVCLSLFSFRPCSSAQTQQIRVVTEGWEVRFPHQGRLADSCLEMNKIGLIHQVIGSFTMSGPPTSGAIWPQADRCTPAAPQSQSQVAQEAFSHLPSGGKEKAPFLLSGSFWHFFFFNISIIWNGSGRAKSRTRR